MRRFIQFLKKIQYPLLFVVLELLAFQYFSNSSYYTQAKMLLSSRAVFGGVDERINDSREYFSLKSENSRLNEEIFRLNNQVERLKTTQQPTNDSIKVDSVIQQYQYTQAKVCRNSVMNQKNFITINKGRNSGIEKDMAIINAGSIVGYIVECSDNYAVAISILNTDFRTSGKLKKNENFGSIYWDGINPDIVYLSDVSKYAEIEVGDTVVSTNYSSIFPPDIIIGTVESFEIVNLTNYHAKIKLTANMRSLNNVLVVKNKDSVEIKELVTKVENIYNQ